MSVTELVTADPANSDPATTDPVTADQDDAPPAGQATSPGRPLGESAAGESAADAADGSLADPPAAGDDVPEQAPAWESPLTALEGRLVAVDARLAEVADRLSAADGRIEASRSRLDAADAAATETATRLTATECRLDLTDTALESGHQAVAALTERVSSLDAQLGAVDSRLVALDARLSGLDDHAATVTSHLADHDRALADLTRSIAAEVERHTSDALVESQHSLQLAVNSIAQLALAMAESSRDITDDVPAESATALLDSFRVDLDAILAQLGFEPLATSVGDVFDPHRHRALKRVSTSDPAQDKVITQVIRDGYRSAGTGRILLFADVEVARHRP